MTQIQMRRDTAANWTSSNPVLADGEIGFENNTGKFKIGNGSSTWGALPYFQNKTQSDSDMIAGIMSHATQSSGAHQASAISFSPSSGISANNVQGAIVEAKSDAASDAAAKVSAHESAANPHSQYARLSAANTFSVMQTVEGVGALIDFINPSSSSGQRRWGQMIDTATGAFQIIPEGDDGALPNAADRFFFFRDRRFRFGGVDQIVGTGNPNGVHSAPVGSVFRNTEAGGWNGARVWRKDAGGGATGWVVESGDTGIRTLPANADVLATNVRLRRIGSTVQVLASGVKSIDALTSGRAIAEIPAGFTPVTPYYLRTYYDNNGYISGSSFQLNTLLPASSGGDFISMTYLTAQAWPDTLPGTP